GWTQATLDVAIHWLLRQCGRVETECRRKCIDLVCTFEDSQSKKDKFKAGLGNNAIMADISERFSRSK
ncbi:unnamed protein product, partial [Didymodactylos carnosus]